MLKKIILLSTLATSLTFSNIVNAQTKVSHIAQSTAEYAASHYQQDMLNTLKTLVSFNTVAKKGVSVVDNPTHIAFKKTLKAQALKLGLDYKDEGAIVIISLSTSGLENKDLIKSEQRIGIITHGDVQPVDASKWAQSPFKLDTTSEPGKLLGRGTEDDKSSIASVLYAMKAIKDQQIKLSKRIELYVYLAEESDWTPIRHYVKTHSLPAINITLDAEYPVVSAEKGYGTISMTFPQPSDLSKVITNTAYIKSFTGGFFGSQIPEDAKIVIANANVTLLEKLMNKATQYKNINFDFLLKDNNLTITTLGTSAHSSKPEDGVNAITYSAKLLSFKHWPNTAAGALVNFINDNLGIDLYGNKFGNIAYSDDFMGKMTVSPTVLKQHLNSDKSTQAIELNINIRRPRGKSKNQLESEINNVLAAWQKENKFTLTNLHNYIGEPWVQKNAPQIPTLLAVFSHFTGIKNAQPIAIGGGTNSRLFPHAVSFGPSMPNTVYTGHSEHEFITSKQFLLNLKMYTAVLIELAN
ncbi:MAG: dipeptidase [Alteromonadaceae bacterium]|nr:dipeptidase [Alteromonadaceae bacterium]